MALVLCCVAGLGAGSSEYVTFQKARENFRKGYIHYNNMQYLAAADYFRKACEVYPDYITGRDYLARSYRMAGYTEAALRELEELQKLSPDNPAINFRIDALRLRSGGIGGVTLTSLLIEKKYQSASYKRFSFRAPVDAAVDEDRNIYITSFENGRVSVIDGNGEGKDTIRPANNGRLFGIDCLKDRLAVSDFRGDTVHVYTTKGKKLASFGGSGNSEGLFHGPEGVCFDAKGFLYVVDSGNGRVQKFDEKGGFILQFGRTGEYEGEMSSPTDIAILGGRAYVTDTENRRIAEFDDCGNFLNNHSLDLERPRGIIRWKGSLLISDEKKGLLVWNPYDGTRKWFLSWGKDEETFGRLTSATVDRDGYLYCVDNHRSEVLLFSPLERRYSNLDVEITSVDVNRFPVVAFYLSVRGIDGRPLYNLDSTNFRVVEDGSTIRGANPNYLKKQQPSVSLELVVDRSETARQWKGDVPWISDFLLTKMHTNDIIRLVNMNSEVWEGSPFDWSRRRTQKAIKNAEYGQGKNTGRALYESLSDLLLKNNRRAVVFVTDGSLSDDSFRDYSVEIVIDYARAHYIPVYIISFREPHPDLVRIAEGTSGRVYRPTELTALRDLYDSIKGGEEYRYVLLYSTFKLPSFTGWWSDVMIEVNHKGQKGIEWGGYFVP